MSVDTPSTPLLPSLIEVQAEHGFVLDYRLTDNFIVRTEIFEMLLKARSCLPSGMNLKLGELYRTLEKQKRMWHEVRETIAKANTHYSEDELVTQTEKWIANPYTHGSGHQSGAAVDITIAVVDEAGVEKHELDMGTKMQEFNQLTVTENEYLTDKQAANRALLLETMTMAGFVNYPEEWWHYSYGDRLWAQLTGASKVYFTALSDQDLRAVHLASGQKTSSSIS